jgi:hypothetical protein
MHNAYISYVVFYNILLPRFVILPACHIYYDIVKGLSSMGELITCATVGLNGHSVTVRRRYRSESNLQYSREPSPLASSRRYHIACSMLGPLEKIKLLKLPRVGSGRRHVTNALWRIDDTVESIIRDQEREVALLRVRDRGATTTATMGAADKAPLSDAEVLHSPAEAASTAANDTEDDLLIKGHVSEAMNQDFSHQAATEAKDELSQDSIVVSLCEDNRAQALPITVIASPDCVHSTPCAILDTSAGQIVIEDVSASSEECPGDMAHTELKLHVQEQMLPPKPRTIFSCQYERVDEIGPVVQAFVRAKQSYRHESGKVQDVELLQYTKLRSISAWRQSVMAALRPPTNNETDKADVTASFIVDSLCDESLGL